MAHRGRHAYWVEAMDTPPALPSDVSALERTAHLMDNAWRIPGTSWRVGLDPLLGLVPGAGDAVTMLMGLGAVLSGWRHHVPTPTLLRMVLNLLVDAGVGVVPVVGDLADATFKAHSRNVALLVAHADLHRPIRPVSSLFAASLVAVAGVLAMLTAASVGAAVWLVSWLAAAAGGG